LRPIILLALVSCGCSSSAHGESATDASIEGGGGLCLTCGGDASIDATALVRVRGEIDQACSSADGCHGSGAGSMGLAPGHEFATMINVPSIEIPTLERVLPGDPERSYVYLKVACEGGIVGECMSGDPRVKQMFYDWIEAGAPSQ
jgi:hypothetical protein